MASLNMACSFRLRTPPPSMRGATGTGHLARRICGVLVIVWACWSPPLQASAKVEIAELTAAFLYNFARFTVWPATAPNGPLTFCVADDDAVATALEAAINGRQIDARPLRLARAKPDEALQFCHVLYAAGLDTRQARQLLERLRGSSTFAVSDFNQFARLGGVADLYLEDGKLRFAINLAAGQRARLTISSTLLRLARIVED